MRARQEIEIVRNPNWDKCTDYRPAFLDSITIEEGNDDLATAARRTLNGSDSDLLRRRPAAGPGPQARRAAVQGPARRSSVRWHALIALNTTVKPFDNINVRKAIIAGFDRNALRLTRGGEILGDIATGWIPPGIPGFEEAGGRSRSPISTTCSPSVTRRCPRSTCWPPSSRTRACR